MNLDDRLARLSPERRALLARRLGQAVPAAEAQIPRQPRDGRTFPLSFAQERLWFEHQLAPRDPSYNETVALRVRGVLDLGRIERAMAELVRRHESLRTGIAETPEGPRQVIAEGCAVPLVRHDLLGQGEAAVDAAIGAEILRPFDLDAPPLLRLSAYRTAEDACVLLLVAHHIILDGWSVAGLFRRIFADYRRQAGEGAERDEPATQYADFAAWERKRLESGALDGELAFWKEQLSEAPPPAALPFDRPRPPLRGPAGGRVVLRWDPSLSEAVRAAARQRQTTVFTILAAAWGLLLARCGGEEEVAFSVPSTTRDLPELEGAVGLFINTLVLRLRAPASAALGDYLRDVGERAAQAQAHRLYPHDRLIARLREEHGLAPAPFTAVMFDVQRLPTEIVPEGLGVDYLDLDPGTSKFELGLSIKDDGERLTATFEYAAELFDRATVEGMAGAYEALVRGMLARPEARLSELALLSEAEAARECAAGAGPLRDFGPARTLHAAFDEIAARMSEATAVASGERSLSYGELAQAANRLAHRLIRQGVRPGEPVAIALDRSVELIVAILGVLKAGAAYVPLDPAWPPAWQAALLAESGAGVVIATGAGAFGAIVCDPAVEGDEPWTAPAVPGGPDDLAYVIHTSGSTGRPRGVAIRHGSVLNLFHALGEAVYARLPDRPLRVAVNGPAAFDTSVKQIVQLLAGHTLDVVPDTVRAAPAELVRYVRERRIDVLDATPTHLGMLLNEGLVEPGGAAPLAVLVGGEAIDPGLWRRLSTVAGTRFFNLYGPAECTVDVTAAGIAGGEPNLGLPLANLRTYVLDPEGRPVPRGMPGELHVGGAGVALGYRGDPGLTAERFIALPFDPGPVYRTGDRVRRRADGRLVFLGRADEQIKLRGYRVEPGEVAALLRQCDGVTDAAVVPRGEGAQQHLVAYAAVAPGRGAAVEGRPRHLLPNGLAVVGLNRNETDFLYEEMFERDAYLRHGIELRGGDLVFDVGANIGLFSLSAHFAAPGVRLHAFEPNPEVFALLKANLSLYGADAVLHPTGLSHRAGRQDFSFYPGFSILSGLYADREAESAVVHSFVRRHERDEAAFDAAGLQELIEDRLSLRQLSVELDTLSGVMARAGVARIDLLKINVEKAEADVLAGIRAEDWSKIRQVALEVHDVDGRLDAIRRLLEEQGFLVAVDQDWRLEDSARTNFYVYARRGERPGSTPRPRPIPAMVTAEALRDALIRQLPDHMVPAEIVLLDALPMTSNGKLDRRRLPGPARTPPAEAQAPRTATEERVAGVWRAVLGREGIGIHDDFFRIGGHSLLATLLMAELRKAMGAGLPLRTLFEAPTIAQLAERIDRDAKPEAEDAALPQIVPDPASWHEPFPLTPIQEAYWMGRNAAFELGEAATQIYLELEQAGWDVARIEAVWNRLVARHDMLRAVILSEQRQQVLPEVPRYAIAVEDLRGLPPEAAAARLAAKRQAMAGETLQPDRWPLFHIEASLLDGDRVRLHVGVDALIADAASLFLLFDEWRRGYEGGEFRPPLAIGFRDYVMAERRLHEGGPYRASRDYWFARLDSLPPAPELPVDRALAARSRPGFTRRSRRLAPALWEALKARAAQAGLTPSLVLIAAYAEILSRWSGSRHFTLNLTTFNRLPLHPDVAGLMGDFTTLTLLEADFSLPMGFEERARALQARLWDDLDHRFISGIEVLRALAQKRRSGTSALMPVVFTSALDIDPAGQGATRFGEVVDSVSQTPQVWLDHQVMEWNGGLVLNWDAVEAIFPPGFLDAMAEAHGGLVDRLATSEEAWTERPGSLLPAAQLDRRAAVNDTAGPPPQGRLEQGFRDQARARPDAVAVVTSTRSVTYGELHARAAEIAGLLQARGQGAGRLVAVAMRKGWEQIAGVLGVLMAGAAYLPVDPDLPEERRHYLLRHCDVAVVLTQSGIAAELAVPAGIEAIAVDALAGDPAAVPPAPASLDDLAYVLFTSGSTGRPKGVMISQRAIANTIGDFARRYGLGPGERTLALSALGFDLSVFDIFAPLSTGGAVVVPDAERLRDPAHMAQMCRAHRVTIWQSVPVLMQLFVEALEASSGSWPADLRTVIMSGDWIPVPLPDRIRALAGSIAIHGQGGATETSINAVVYPIGEVDPAWRSIPYGKPFANQTAHILDGELEPAPDWVPGELYIGGMGLAEGYWKDPDATAAAFITHPCTGERLYRTGDHGRFLPDGNIEFLGRRDNQVKINGYRIELGEIEAALRQHPEVAEAVVAAPADAAGGRMLAAYVVRAEEAGADVGAELGTEGVLLDPVARLTFKLDRKGLRALPEEAAAVPLASRGFDEARRLGWLRRQSIRRFVPQAVTLAHIADWLGVLEPMPVPGAPLPKMRYPSAGSLYPVQLYLAVKPGAVRGLEGGAYYYDPGHDPAGHRLVRVGAEGDLSRLYPRANRGIVEAAAFSVVLVGKRAAVEPLYGPLWRDFCLLEAGQMGQLLADAAADASLGLCALGLIDEAGTRAALGLDEGHAVLHSLAGGAVSDAQMEGWAPEEAPQHGAGSEALRAWLARRLPDYMVPRAFVFLDRLPQNANGKIDRAALPPPEARRPAGAGAAPSGGVETAIAAALAAVLQQDAPGTEANFFDLGANSVHLVQLHRRLQADLGRAFPLVDLFQNPSIRQLASHLAGEGEDLDADGVLARAERARAGRSRRLARRRAGLVPHETGMDHE